MTSDKLNEILKDCKNGYISKNTAKELIWGQPFDGVTEKIVTKDKLEDHKTNKPTKPNQLKP